MNTYQRTRAPSQHERRDGTHTNKEDRRTDEQIFNRKAPASPTAIVDNVAGSSALGLGLDARTTFASPEPLELRERRGARLQRTEGGCALSQGRAGIFYHLKFQVGTAVHRARIASPVRDPVGVAKSVENSHQETSEQSYSGQQTFLRSDVPGFTGFRTDQGTQNPDQSTRST